MNSINDETALRSQSTLPYVFERSGNDHTNYVVERSGNDHTNYKKRQRDPAVEEINSLSRTLLTQHASIRANVDLLNQKIVVLESEKRQLKALNQELGAMNRAQGTRIWELEQQVKNLQSKAPVVLKPDMLGGGCHGSQL